MIIKKNPRKFVFYHLRMFQRQLQKTVGAYVKTTILFTCTMVHFGLKLTKMKGFMWVLGRYKNGFNQYNSIFFRVGLVFKLRLINPGFLTTTSFLIINDFIGKLPL